MNYLIRIVEKLFTLFIYLIIKFFNRRVEIKGVPIILSNIGFIKMDNKKSRIIIGRKYAQRDNTILECKDGGKLEIGNNVFFNRNCIITCLHEIKVGNNCIFGPNVLMFDHDHLFDENAISKNSFKYGTIEIGDNTWIGASCIILRNTYIGKGCVIGAGSILTGTIPDYTVVTSTRELKFKTICNNGN